MVRLSTALVLASTLVAGAVVVRGQQPARTPATGTMDWLVEGAGRAGDVKVDRFLGRQALWLRNGTHAIKSSTTLIDGTIEFDIAPMAHGDFAAVVFRRDSLADHENIYIRPPRAGEFMAIQYAPRMNGSSTWQLYPQFTAAAPWPRNQWTHVRVEVSGSRLQVFVDGAETPTLSVARLRHTTSGSEVAFWARVNNQPSEWAAALSNIQIRPSAQRVARIDAAVPTPGFVDRWEVAGPVRADDAPVEAIPSGLDWRPVVAEENGLVNVNRLFRVATGRFTAFARTTVNVGVARRVLAGIGYSDDVTVFVNGEPVYSGVNGWESRLPGFVSFVDPRFERVGLPLRAGANEVVLAVTDDQRFGWGCAMSLLPSLASP